MAATDIVQRDLSDRVLRDAYGQFATGVAIVTTCTATGERIGATISSFNAVSLQPPLIMFSISHQSKAFPVWHTAKHFAVNVLAQDQGALSSRFARALSDKWNDVRHSKGKHDIPLLAGCLACFECERHAHHAGGDHLIIVGRVDAVHSSPRGKVGPLIFSAASMNRLLDREGTKGRTSPSSACKAGETTLGLATMLSAANQLCFRVDRIRPEARDVLSLELVSARGESLPAWTPGSHIDLVLPNGLVRQYSLCNLDQPADRYRIAVARSASSEGGSDFIHDTVRRGAELRGGGPRNNFPLVHDAERYVFIAGGIGITPILSMILWCSASRKPWRLLYCCQTRQRAAFVDDILAIPGGAVNLHFDSEHGGAGPDLATVLATLGTSEHVYCCGPAGLMNAVSSKVPESHRRQLHFEWFKAASVHVPPSTEFDVVLQRSGLTLKVPPNSSILEVLENNGISAAFGCRSGFCGCCETRVLAGEPDHRDSVLSEQARAQNDVIMICVSRARNGKLVLDA